MAKQFLDITGVGHLWGKSKELFATKAELAKTTGKAEQAINQANSINQELLNKQDKLVSGSNIKTIGKQSLLGEGDIPLPDLTPYATTNAMLEAIQHQTGSQIDEGKIVNGTIIGEGTGPNDKVVITGKIELHGSSTEIPEWGDTLENILVGLETASIPNTELDKILV